MDNISILWLYLSLLFFKCSNVRGVQHVSVWDAELLHQFSLCGPYILEEDEQNVQLVEYLKSAQLHFAAGMGAVGWTPPF